MGLISRVSSRTYRKTMGNKPRGIKCARKLRNNRRLQRWADLDYKKAHLGTTLKANPFGGSSHAKGIVVEKIGVEAKQPNSAIRKCVRVQLIKNGKRITAFVPNDGSLNYIEENDEVLVSGFGRRGHAVGISQALGLRWSRWLTFHCWPCSRARRRGRGRKLDDWEGACDHDSCASAFFG